jgi:hypothetical protein
MRWSLPSSFVSWSWMALHRWSHKKRLTRTHIGESWAYRRSNPRLARSCSFARSPHLRTGAFLQPVFYRSKTLARNQEQTRLTSTAHQSLLLLKSVTRHGCGFCRDLRRQLTKGARLPCRPLLRARCAGDFVFARHKTSVPT